jgi:hypothetical protein
MVNQNNVINGNTQTQQKIVTRQILFGLLSAVEKMVTISPSSSAASE